MLQPDSALLLHSSEAAAPGCPPEVLSDTVPIVLRWQQLASMDRQSPAFLHLLSSLTAEENRSLTTKLRFENARVTLNIIDEVFSEIPGECELNTLITMQMLAYNSGQVPPHYKVDQRSFSVGTRVISQGRFADVREGRLGDKMVAVRTPRTGPRTSRFEAYMRFCKECIIWMSFSHPNILELIAVDVNPLTGRYSMISEMMMNGNIKEYIRKNPVNRHRLLEGAATGLHYLHEHGIVHGDLKGLNILITNDAPPRACLANFGSSGLVPGAQGAMTTVTVGGTPAFMAPELLCPTKFNESSSRPTQPADIYAFGIVIYEVLTGLQPFYEKKWTNHELLFHMMGGARPKKPADAEKIGFGDGTWELVEECWIAEPTRRPTIDQVLVHLKRVAAYSKVVGPTPVKLRTPEYNYTREIYPFLSRSVILSRIISQDSTESAVQLEPWEADLAAFLRAHGTGNMVTRRREAQKFADRLDVALDNRDLHGQKRKEYRKFLQELCGGSCILPSSFALAPKYIKCEAEPFASGSFSKVYKATFKGRPVAIKTLKICDVADHKKVHKFLVKEVVGWKWLQHENILPFVGVTSTPAPISIVSERMENGNIMDFTKAHPNHNRLDLLVGAAAGLEHLHEYGIVHGDLKGANILIDYNHCARLADFGLAVVIDESTGRNTAHRGEGTPRWMAPELLLPDIFGFTDKQLPTRSTDVYAFGMTILKVITGCHPFGDIARKETVIYKVIEGNRPERPSLGFSDTLWELLVRTWDAEDGPKSQKRPSVSIVRDRLREDVSEWGKLVAPLSPGMVDDPPLSFRLSPPAQNKAKKSLRLLPSWSHLFGQRE